MSVNLLTVSSIVPTNTAYTTPASVGTNVVILTCPSNHVYKINSINFLYTGTSGIQKVMINGAVITLTNNYSYSSYPAYLTEGQTISIDYNNSGYIISSSISISYDDIS